MPAWHTDYGATLAEQSASAALPPSRQPEQIHEGPTDRQQQQQQQQQEQIHEAPTDRQQQQLQPQPAPAAEIRPQAAKPPGSPTPRPRVLKRRCGLDLQEVLLWHILPTKQEG